IEANGLAEGYDGGVQLSFFSTNQPRVILFTLQRPGDPPLVRQLLGKQNSRKPFEFGDMKYDGFRLAIPSTIGGQLKVAGHTLRVELSTPHREVVQDQMRLLSGQHFHTVRAQGSPCHGSVMNANPENPPIGRDLSKLRFCAFESRKGSEM